MQDSKGSVSNSSFSSLTRKRPREVSLHLSMWWFNHLANPADVLPCAVAVVNSLSSFRRAICGLCLLVAVTAMGATPKRVLIVHSFVNAAPPFITHSTAFEVELTSKMGEPVDLDEVTLDVARHPDAKIQQAQNCMDQQRPLTGAARLVYSSFD